MPRLDQDRDRWLAQVKEEIREPGLPICDPHHHLWNHPGRRYLNSFKRIAAGFGAQDTAALFHDTAARVYRVDGGA